MRMNIILVDDERLALAKLENMLKAIGGCDVIGTFRSAEQALEQIGGLQPDVVFLDIHMPGMNGLQAIEKLREVVPDTEIVLITAHGEYALKAFGLDVLDYVVKPVGSERLAHTVQRLRKRITARPAASQPPEAEAAQLHCLGMLRMRKADGQLSAPSWRSAKIKELFAYLFHQRFKRVSISALLELLWPELDEQRGRMNLHTGIYQLRRVIKDAVGESCIAIRYSNSGYMMETSGLMIDALEWEQRLERLPPASMEHIGAHRQLFESYGGAYFGEDRYAWAETERGRLHTLWAQHAERLAGLYDGHGLTSEAISVYSRMQQLDPVLERSYIGMMNLYARLNDRNAFEAQYSRAVQVLREEAGASPGPELAACYQRWKHADPALS